MRRPSGGITDDVLTVGPGSVDLRAYLREGGDRLVGADPGLTQLRTALQAVLGIAAAVGLAYSFTHLTGGLQKSAGDGPVPAVAAYNHALLIVTMLLAGMVAMMAGFTVTDNTARAQLISTAVLPVPMVAAMTVGLALGPYRLPSLIFLVVLLAVAVYVRRWGPRGFAAGLVAFNGGFLGFFLHAEIGLGDLGWIAADLALGALASLVVRFALFRPDLDRTLARMRRSWEARARRLQTLSVLALGTDDPGRCADLQERLRRQVIRLNESTLMIDAQLAVSVPRTAAVEAQRLFDAELALSSCARFAGALAAIGADADLRRAAGVAFTALRDDDWPAARAAGEDLRARTAPDQRATVLAHRLGASVEEYIDARQELRQAMERRIEGRSGSHLGSAPTPPSDLPPVDLADDFTPAVGLNAGFLPGSVPVSTAASMTRGRGGVFDRATMPPHVRATIQITVAATIAVVVGDFVSGPRLYWAVLATFLAFMATTNSGEQIRKALFRVSGTAIGIVVGDLLVRVTGGHVWSSLLIVLVALFFGIYLIRVNYTFMVIGITVTMSQLYVQLGEFSWHLLLLRLGETAIGVGAVVLTVLFIVPLRPQRVLATGVLLWFRSLNRLLDVSLDRLLGADPIGADAVDPVAISSSRGLIREMDAAYAALEATARPLRRSTFGRNSAQMTEIGVVSAAARGYARSLATEAAAAGCLDAPELAGAAAQLRASAAGIDRRIETGEHGIFVRSAALLEIAARSVTPDRAAARLALRDLTLLDGALARLAQALQMEVTDHDTTPSPRQTSTLPD